MAFVQSLKTVITDITPAAMMYTFYM